MLGHRFDGKKAFILIDIEGAEYQLLQGAKILLDAVPKPVWMIEIDVASHRPNHEKNPHLLATFKLFQDHGYQAYALGETMTLLDAAKILRSSSGADDVRVGKFCLQAKKLGHGIIRERYGIGKRHHAHIQPRGDLEARGRERPLAIVQGSRAHRRERCVRPMARANFWTILPVKIAG